MKNILVPCDFSKPAEEAFKLAVKIASISKGEIHVLYVIDITFLRGIPSLSNAYAFNLNFLRDAEKMASEKFQIMCGKHAPISTKIKFKHAISSLTSEIESYVNDHGIDLVIMGTHGEGDTRWGSNTEKIVRTASVPVLSIRTAPKSIKNIVCPVLPDQPDSRFIQSIKELQTFFDAKLHLFYINTPLFFKSDPDAAKALNAFATENKFTNYTTHIRSDYTVEAGIAHFAKEIGADLIAMGTHAWKGLAHFFIGSTAEDIVNHVNMPIWTLRLS